MPNSTKTLLAWCRKTRAELLAELEQIENWLKMSGTVRGMIDVRNSLAMHLVELESLEDQLLAEGNFANASNVNDLPGDSPLTMYSG